MASPSARGQEAQKTRFHARDFHTADMMQEQYDATNVNNFSLCAHAMWK